MRSLLCVFFYLSKIRNEKFISAGEDHFAAHDIIADRSRNKTCAAMVSKTKLQFLISHF